MVLVVENRVFFPDFQLTVIKKTATGQFMLSLNIQLMNWAESTNILSHVWVWLSMGFGLVIGFIELLQIVTASNNSTIANSHMLQFTTARTKSSQFAVSLLVVWSQIATLSYQVATVPQLTLCSKCPTYTSRHGTYRKHCSSVAVQLLLNGLHRKHQSSSSGCYTFAYLAGTR
jgi:hypothetical protein